MNSCGRSFHIDSKASSARQRWSVLACISDKLASQHRAPHDNPMDRDLANSNFDGHSFFFPMKPGHFFSIVLGKSKSCCVSRCAILLKDEVVRQEIPAVFDSKLEYCIQAWRPYLCKDELLEKVQRRATRLMFSDKSLGYYSKLGLTTLETRRLRGDIIEVFKILRVSRMLLTILTLLCLSQDSVVIHLNCINLILGLILENFLFQFV